MEIVIRKITTADATEITTLTEQLGYKMPAAQILENITAVIEHNDCDAFVALLHGELIGWIGLAYRIQLESAPFCEINGLVVREQYRGKGVGKMLIDKAKSWSIERGCNCLRLRTNVMRHEAHKFYIALGFDEVKQQKVFEITI